MSPLSRLTRDEEGAGSPRRADCWRVSATSSDLCKSTGVVEHEVEPVIDIER
jgi:hypothetical protein